MRSTKTVAYVKIIFVNVMWGISFIASKHALSTGFSPFSLACVRYILATLLLLPLARGHWDRLSFPRKDAWLLIASALTGTTIYFLFEYMGLERTTASNASLILSAMPVFTMLYALLFQKARYRLICYPGVLLSLVGVYFVVRYGGDGGGSLAGNLLLLGACLCWVAYVELSGALLRRYDSLRVTFWQSLIAVVTSLPLAMTESVAWRAIPPSGWGSVLFLAAICSALCYILYNDAIARLDSLRIALFINLNPIAAVLGGVALLGETVSAPQLFGGALILLSIFIVNRFSAVPRPEA